MVEIYNEAIYDLLDENDLDKDNKYQFQLLLAYIGWLIKDMNCTKQQRVPRWQD